MANRTHNRDAYIREAGPYADFVREMVESSRYESVAEVIMAGLELLRDEELLRRAKLERLHKGVQLRIEQADAGELIPAEEVFTRLRAAIKAKSPPLAE